MVSLVSRQGRELQRYTNAGGRLVVGCIPYKLSTSGDDSDAGIEKSLQVLVINSQKKRHDMLFPKGGWELDETIREAALREAVEEAGVVGDVEAGLGKWSYMSRRHGVLYEGVMFPLNVTEELARWPEEHARERRWVSAEEVKKGCPHVWMKEALDKLVVRLRQRQRATTPSA